MNLLEEYQKLMETETDNEFPEEMQHDGLSESDRNVYEEVLNKMRADMDKANEEMRKNSKSWGTICEEVNGSIQNKTFKIDNEMMNKVKNTYKVEPHSLTSTGVKMYRVSEPIGFFIDGFRCPHCQRLMHVENESYVCSVCGYPTINDDVGCIFN